MLKNHVLYFKEPYKIEIREEQLPEVQDNELLVKTITSAVSSGTEMLVYRGQLPAGIAIDETIDTLKENFEYPLRYGYACVGEVIDTESNNHRNLTGKKVFAFQPHGAYFTVPIENAIFIPDMVSMEDAVLYPNLETAVNLVMDGRPLIGEDVVVIGAGMVGLFTIALLKQFPLDSLTVIEPLPNRQQAVKDMGIKNVYHPDEFTEIIQSRQSKYGISSGADLVFECSGSNKGLQSAIDSTGFDGRIVAGSWYGSRPVTLDLGSRFHRQRIKLISSQVSSITPDLMSRWSHQRRSAITWKQVEKIQPSRWVTHRFSVCEAQEAYNLIDQHPEQCLQVLFKYS
jgi:2-desacetyl-2-hydroxyethyl bacteriochlorophyllide A dehydrogenase